jgi:hypothetical protein
MSSSALPSQKVSQLSIHDLLKKSGNDLSSLLR